ncbi:hypothetical protein TIFTF001_048313, partial [Ficus carica]
ESGNRYPDSQFSNE